MVGLKKRLNFIWQNIKAYFNSKLKQYTLTKLLFRLGRWELCEPPPMGSPTNAMIGPDQTTTKYLKGIVHQFWKYITFFRATTKETFLWKVHLDKTALTRNNWENRMLKVSPTEYCYIYIIYITWTAFEHLFSQLFRVKVVLSRWTFYKKCFFR